MSSFKCSFKVIRPLDKTVRINSYQYKPVVVDYAGVNMIALFEESCAESLKEQDCILDAICSVTDMTKKVNSEGLCLVQWGLRVARFSTVEEQKFVPMDRPAVVVFGRILKHHDRKITIVSKWHKEFYCATINMMDERRMFYRIPVLAFGSHARKLFEVTNKSMVELQCLVTVDRKKDCLELDVKGITCQDHQTTED